MKKYSILSLICLLFVLASCESFLDTDNYTQKNEANFPVNASDVEMMLTGAYSSFNHMIGEKGQSHPTNSYFYIAEVASDERFGGGQFKDKNFQTIDKLMNYTSNMMQSYWKACYEGIYRTNQIISCVDKITGWKSENDKNQKIGEAYFLRGLLYQYVAQIFGEAPLTLSVEAVNLPKASPEELHASITSDFMKAIEIMPDTKYSPAMSGHATKYVAEAFLAREFLFYTGYYKKETLPLRDGGSVSQKQVVTYLEDCINNSGHGLIGDFRNLWPYTNPYTINEYKYTKDVVGVDGKPLAWATDVNKEILFAVKYNTLASWQDRGFSNMNVLFFGLRGGHGKINTFPLGKGWGCGTVNPTLWNDWERDEPSDLRREASICNAPKEFGSGYKMGDNQMEDTGLWQKKYIPINGKTKDGKLKNYPILMYNAMDNIQLSHARDQILMRFADVLLMHSELTGTADGINKVRARVALPAVSYSLDNLKKERRYELAFEGVRWFDIMRWGDAADLLDKQAGIEVNNQGTITKMKNFGSGYKARYNETGGFWPIPQSQIELSNGVLKQNKGWGTPEAEYTGW